VVENTMTSMVESTVETLVTSTVAQAIVRLASEPADGCMWEAHGGKLICEAHRVPGRRAGVGKLFRVSSPTGQKLVRAVDERMAKAAAALGPNSMAERASPADADREPVLDARPIVHSERKAAKGISAKGEGRPWVSAQPPQFTEPPIECALSGWERGLLPSRWIRFARRLRRATATATRK
jgi:hypothetical protein